jgi:molybdenum cofactor biosynthesis protein B
MGHEEHKEHGPKVVRVYVLTISDTRTEEDDTSGKLARELIAAWGHEVAGPRIVKDEPKEVAAILRDLTERAAADVIITSGGTGVSRRDSTYEAIWSLLDKRLDGFGELFRMLSYDEIGSAAMMSRAIGGISKGVAIFALPGSSNAVKLGMEKLILPELGHLVFEKGR